MLLHGHKTSTKTPNLRAQGLARAGPDASADLASLLYAAASQHTAAAAREATAAGAARPAEARACSQPAPRSPEFTASGIATARLGSLTGPGPAPPSLNEPPAAPARRTAPRALHRERRGPAPSAAIQPLPPTRSSPRLAPPLPLALANRLSASCGRTSGESSPRRKFRRVHFRCAAWEVWCACAEVRGGINGGVRRQTGRPTGQ